MADPIPGPRHTAIAWTGRTWNPVTGCDKAGTPGCENCYALRLAARLQRMGAARYANDGNPVTSGPGFGVTLHRDLIDQPRHWRKGTVVFVNSMSDVFHAKVPFEFVDAMFATMTDTPRHTYQILTKRSRRMARYAASRAERGLVWPSNVWAGVSVEDNERVYRADDLLDVPAPVRFVSAEPLLGPVPDLAARFGPDKVNWVIVGGESGPGHRPFDPEWARQIRDAADAAGVPFFFKQHGGPKPDSGGHLLDGQEYRAIPLAVPAGSAG